MRLAKVGLLVVVLLGAFALRSLAATRRVPGARAKRRWLGRDEMLAATVAAILAITLLPVGGGNEIHLNPVGRPSVINDVGNLLLFAPLGVVLFLRRWPPRNALLAGLALSTSIEVVQLAVSGRTTSTADVIWNTLGTGAGWAAAAFAWRRLAARRACRT
jgi:glycopeptide antibiotics resistance protein